jgi:hypothetical protein
MADNFPYTHFDSQADVDECLSTIEKRLRFLEDFFSLCLKVQHSHIDVELGADAYGALAEFCRVAGNDLANLEGRLPFEAIRTRLASLVPRPRQPRRGGRVKSRGVRKQGRKNGRGTRRGQTAS